MEMESEESNDNNISRLQTFWKWVYIPHLDKYLDLTIITMAIPSCMYGVNLYINGGVTLHPSADKLTETQKEELRKVPYIMAGIIITFVWVFAIWATVHFMKSIEAQFDRETALKLARFFRNLNIVFILGAVIDLFFCKFYIFCGLSFVWYFVLAYLACQSIYRLNNSTIRSANPENGSEMPGYDEGEGPSDAVFLIEMDESV